MMRRMLTMLAALGAVSLGATSALAQSGRIPNTDWRRFDRPSRPDSVRSPQSFAFELRFGPYYPQVDEEFEGTTGSSKTDPQPFNQTFGDDGQFYFGLEFDWLPIRIPYIGAFGPGFGWGYTRTSENAKVEGSDTESAQETSFTVMPMHLSAVARFDEFMRRTEVPVVPYVKGGIAFATWSAGNSSGTADYNGTLGRGTSWGTHFAVGGMLSLNWLDKSSAASLDETSGVNHAYLFGEWMLANLDGLGTRPQMHVGTSTWVVGLALDM